MFYWINDDIHQSECLQSVGHFTFLFPSAASIPLAADDVGRSEQQDQRQTHEADATQNPRQ